MPFGPDDIPPSVVMLTSLRILDFVAHLEGSWLANQSANIWLAGRLST